MNINDAFLSVFGLSVWFIFKLMILTLLVLYLFFAFVMVRQEQLMSRVVEIPDAPYLQILVLVHFFASLTVFILALIYL